MPKNVRLPDGTVVRNVPDNITQSELLERVARMRGEPAQAPPTAASINERLSLPGGSVFLGTRTPGEGGLEGAQAGARSLAAFGEIAALRAGQRFNNLTRAVQNLGQRFISDNQEERVLAREQRAISAQQEAEFIRERERRAVQSQELPEGGVETARFIGKFGPDVAAGAGAFSAAKGITQRILAETVLGGAEGLSIDPFATTASMLGNVSIGMGAGMLLGTVGETPDMFRRFITAGAIDDVVKARGLQTGNVFRPDEDTQLAGFDLSLGESGRSNILRQAESMLGAPGGPKEQFVFNRTQQMLTRLDDMARAFDNSDLSFDTALTQSFRVYDQAVNEIRERAGNAFREALRPGLAAVGARIAKDGTITDGRRVIPLNNYLGSLNRQARALEEAGDVSAAKKMRDEIALWEERGGTITIGGMQELLSDFSSMAAGTGSAATRAATAGDRRKPSLAISALMDDLEDAASNFDDFVAREGDPITGLRNIQATLETAPTPGGVRGVPADPRQRGGTFDQPRETDFTAGPEGVRPELRTPPAQRRRQARGGPGTRADEPRQRPDIPGQTLDVEAQERFTVPVTELDMSPRQARQAAEALRAAREQFRIEIAPINVLKKTGIDRLLGGERLLGVDEFTDTFQALPPSQKQKTLELLDSRRPELGRVLRQRMWLEMLQRNSTRSPASTTGQDFTSVDIAKLTDDLTSGSGAREFDMLIPPDVPASVARQAKAGLRVLNRIKETQLQQEKMDKAGFSLGSIISGLREKSINFVEQNPGFVARMLAGEVGPHVIERWLFTEQGLQRLARLGGPKPLRGAIETGALAGLVDLAVEAEEERLGIIAAAERRAQQEQRAAQIQQRREGRGQ